MITFFNTLMAFSSLCITMNLNLSKEKLEGIVHKEVYEIISNNINLFNKSCEGGEKEATHFKKVTDCFNVLSPYNNELIGTLLLFDRDTGYICISNDNRVIDSNYQTGIKLVGESKDDNSIYYLAHTYSFDRELLFSSVDMCGSGINDKFHWHGDYAWTNEKTRYLQSELDSYYSTRTNTSNASYSNKTTWSTYQGSNGLCGAFAVANLLWTYKINGVVDLTNGATNSSSLAYTISQDIPNNASFNEIDDINDTLLNGTGYYMDYCDITNGISDTLETSPLVVLYNSGTEGHYVLITGKGESLYQTIMWMNFYTSWDIANTWYDRYSTNNGYYTCKYWVDNQYASFGYVLRDGSGEAVPL